MLSSYLHCIYLEINTCLFMHFTIEVMDISFFAETKVFKNQCQVQNKILKIEVLPLKNTPVLVEKCS